MPRPWVRARAVLAAVFYGFAPWPLYERRCHYRPLTYCAHAALNLRYLGRWLWGEQTLGDVRFEVEVNGSGRRRRGA